MDCEVKLVLKTYYKIGSALALTCVLANAAEQRPTDLAHWLTLLNSREPALRSEGRQQLMGESTADLEQLRRLLTAKPCPPAQVDALEDVVTYVVARANIGATADSGKPFLGVEFADDDFSIVTQDQQRPCGVPIRPLPGFVSYRYLQDGDVIIGLGTGKDLKLTPTREDFAPALSNYSAGDKITLHVQRGGNLMDITLTLDRRPTDTLNGADTQERAANAQMVAEAYWTQQFRPLLTPAEND